MKKIFAIVLVLALALCVFASCGKQEVAPTAPSSWDHYDELISEIRAETDLVAREALMHEAEDVLMESGAILPVYYYNDIYLMKDGIEGFYCTPYGYKYFMNATYGDATTLRINLASEPDKLDPALNSSVDGACLAVNSFGGLYTYDANNQLVPNFAEKCEESEDGLTYVFTMRDGLKWSDGTPLTAKDFEYSWTRAVATETASDYAYMYDSGNIASWKASDDGKTFTVTLASPSPYFFDLCAFPTFYAVNQACVEASQTADNPGAWATEVGFVCSGAYMLTEWTHDVSMVYEKNPNYWDAANVKIERLEFMLSADDTAIFAAYNAGDLDFADTVPTDEIANLLTNKEFYVVDQLGTYYVGFNVKSNLFGGKTVEQANAMRRAFALLVDRDYICETVGQTGQKPATSFLPYNMSDGHGGEFKSNDNAYTYPDATSLGYFPVDPDVAEAIALLESAGYEFKDGKLSSKTPISMEYLTNDGTGHIAVAECIQQDFAKVGIDMTIRTCDWNTFLDERKAGNYDIARNGWVADFNDPINMLEMWTIDSGNNDCQFGRFTDEEAAAYDAYVAEQAK